MNTTKKFDFNKKISLNFDGGQISGNSGLLLLHEFCEKIGVGRLLKQHLPENRVGNFEHKKPDIVYQKIMRIINGDTSNNNYEFHKNDPTFLNIHNQKIASSPTCSRLENTFNYSDVDNLRTIQREIDEVPLEGKR